MTSNEEARSVTEQNGTRKARDNPKKSLHANNDLRVSKDDLYMIIALWMEDLVDKAPEHHRKVGAVLVLPNDVVLAADCSRDGVHAVARLLMKHHNKAEGCKMFMSRKPCPFCAKLLVQSKVKRVLYLPLEPEYYRSPESVQSNDRIAQYNDEQMKQVDILFTASAIAQTKFAVQVDESVRNRAKKDSPTDEEIKAEEYKNALIDIYGFKKTSEWMKAVKKELPWPVFDNQIKKEVQEYFDEVMDWIATVLVRSGGGLDYEFESCNEKSKSSEGFNPVNDPTHAKQARHFIAIARFLAWRTDDPEVGVGAVIVSPNPKMEILALGWNGFPLKAHYGEFATASKDRSTDNKDRPTDNKDRPTDDEPEEQPDKKYPYVIHAEQNAILMRNNKNIEGAILFVTKSPCNECAPLIAMQGIETVVVDANLKQEKPEWYELGHTLGYNLFFEMVKDDNIICYKTKKKPTKEKPAKEHPVSEDTQKELDFSRGDSADN